jgi:hypothetical protein
MDEKTADIRFLGLILVMDRYEKIYRYYAWMENGEAKRCG